MPWHGWYDAESLNVRLAEFVLPPTGMYPSGHLAVLKRLGCKLP